MDSYTGALHTIFVMYAPIVALCFIGSWFVQDNGVAEKDASSEERRALLGEQSADPEEASR